MSSSSSYKKSKRKMAIQESRTLINTDSTILGSRASIFSSDIYTYINVQVNTPMVLLGSVSGYRIRKILTTKGS